ncbi:XRE family transcriptional regulator [Streptomyces viridochromogenes]|uniref:XRE family transcriptional regulator n=1 Tax=Streptomyces viridochromogenes TaxID=1938 RepID=UPI001F474660|nr:XRE family transcriptional regulator [Streptomyces viridochromogenes]
MTEQRTDFADLVRQRRAELNISVRKLAEQSVDPETGERPFKFGWVSKLERGENTDAPSEAILRALHVGLALPLRVVQEAAAAQYLGMRSHVWSQDRTTRVLAARIEEMSDEERRQLAEIAETFARRRTQSDGNSGE